LQICLCFYRFLSQICPPVDGKSQVWTARQHITRCMSLRHPKFLGKWQTLGELVSGGCAPKWQSPWSVGLGAKPPPPEAQKLKAFRRVSSIFLYFLRGIVEIQHLDVIFTVTAGA